MTIMLDDYLIEPFLYDKITIGIESLTSQIEKAGEETCEPP
jgi:two-component SAPR family response regulator